MSQFHVYIQPFDGTGAYTGTYTEVTGDVDQGTFASIKQQLDNTEYDIGILRFSNFSLKFRNDHGKYNDVDSPYSMFASARADSIVKITWEPADHALYCGFFTCGDTDAILSEEVDVFYGLLNDDSSQTDVEDQTITFSVLGPESKLKKEVDTTTPITNGTSFSSAITTILTASSLYTLPFITSLSVSVGVNKNIDDVTPFNNQSYQNMIQDLLLASNSVMYITVGGVITVKPRTVSASLMYTFYGQNANDGLENIMDINNFKTGLQRVLNYIVWDGVAGARTDAGSISLYGKRQKTINLDFVTNATSQNDIRDSLLTEFAASKAELLLDTPLKVELLSLKLLDKVTIDFPSQTIIADDANLPIYGQAVYGVDRYPDVIGVLSLTTTEFWKIMSISIDVKNDTVTYGLRKV